MTGNRTSALLPDLAATSLDALRDLDPDQLAPYLLVLRAQVERPRPNLGAGPPGRAD